MDKLDLSEYHKETKRIDQAFKAEFLKQYAQTIGVFSIFAIVVFTLQWALQ